MSKQTEAMKLQTIMEQAQVFASAWSLVGGRFDGGNAMDDAEVAKNELRQMVAEALAKQPAQQEPTTKHTKPFESARVGDYNRGWNDCLFASGIVKQTEQPAQQEPVALPEGKKLILVDGSFDDLMYWLERCEDKGHLENCLDLVEPWENFSYEECTTPPAQQEPVGEVSGHDWSTGILYRDLEPGAPLYTSPPAQRKPLADEAIRDCWSSVQGVTGVSPKIHAFARAIEAAHGIKGDA